MNRILKTVLLLLCTAQVEALEFNQLQPAQSALSFGYRQMGVAMDGKFNKFTAQISFDPAKLASAQARIDVSLASIDTGSADADEEVAGRLWFNAKTYPLASFVSTGVKQLAGNRYQATGKLTIKGKTLDIVAPVTFQSDGLKGSFDGSFNIKRLSYGIGTGEWADLSTVADDIQIVFHLVVNAAPVKK
ncbi:MAG: YceI family protein [Proteobacteria bacterium]|nr:YceI family protein [Pseudomonadota bacterium]